jgi:hypothetical protein
MTREGVSALASFMREPIARMRHTQNFKQARIWLSLNARFGSRDKILKRPCFLSYSRKFYQSLIKTALSGLSRDMCCS